MSALSERGGKGQVSTTIRPVQHGRPSPNFAPGTGTPEIGGPNSFQAIEVVRHLQGVNIIGADLVEVSPPFDPSGGTAYLGATLIFEMLCVIAPTLRSRR